MEIQKCVNCGKVIANGSTVCQYCGAKQPVEASATPSREDVKADKSLVQRKSIVYEVASFATPLIGFIIVASITGGIGIGSLLGMLMFALLGCYFGYKGMKQLPHVSYIMFGWNFIVTLGMLLAVLG